MTIDSALIIGGGIAGTVTAMALRRAGIAATVYEAYDTTADGVGGALTLSPNGRNALRQIDADDVVIFAVQLDIPSAAKLWIGVFGFVIELTIPALYAYVSELYPTRLRASGFGWSSTISRIGAGFVPLIFGSLLWPYLGLPMTFAVIGVLATLAAVWMAIAAPETKGRELDQLKQLQET